MAVRSKRTGGGMALYHRHLKAQLRPDESENGLIWRTLHPLLKQQFKVYRPTASKYFDYEMEMANCWDEK
jgi:hypothetical protein